MSTATMNPVVLEATALSPKHENSHPAIDFGPRQSFLSLVRIELRKMVDTRSGRWLLTAILGLTVLALGWGLTHLPFGPVRFSDMLDMALTPVSLILPVIGIMAMTSEWTQRTALTTFTLSPRRTPVLLAKLTAAIALSMAVVAVAVGMAFAATAIGGVLSGGGASYAHALSAIGGGALANALYVVMAAGIGLVATVTAVGVLIFYVAPAVWAGVGPLVLDANSKWLDIFGSLEQLSLFDVSGHVPQMITSMAAWIVLPVTVGLVLANRREVK